MTIDLGRLATAGRAFSAARPWTPEELDALLALEQERTLTRTEVADYVRNGILTVEDFDKATKAKFKPKTLAEAEAGVETSLKEHGASVTKKSKKK